LIAEAVPQMQEADFDGIRGIVGSVLGVSGDPSEPDERSGMHAF